MGEKEKLQVKDVVKAVITPPVNGGKQGNKEYGAILSANNKNIHEIADIAIAMKKQTKKPIMIVLGGDNG